MISIDQHSVEHFETLEAMELYGGAFVRALAGAWRRADPDNHHRLLCAFPEYYEQYRRMVVRRHEPSMGVKEAEGGAQ